MRLPLPLPRVFEPVSWAAILQMDPATRTETAAYTAAPWDHTIRVDATAGAVTVTLPPASLHTGKVYVVLKVDASGNAVTINPDAAETINGAATRSLAAQFNVAMIQSNGASWDVLSAS
jgi:hypothetical protein